MKSICSNLCRLILILIIICSLSLSAFAAVSSGDGPDYSTLPGNQDTGVEYSTTIKSCANMGNWQKYAENSVEAIADCSTDFVSVDVKITSDGVPVLMADDTVDRMCVDSDGNPVSGAIKDKTYQEIESYFLRYGNGGSISVKSEYKVATLSGALKAINTGVMMIIDVSLEDSGVAYTTVASEGKLNRVLFRITDCSGKDIVSISQKNPEFKGLIIPQYNGNIIFGATSLMKSSAEASMNVVKLGTKNVNGVVLYESFTKKFSENSVMAMFSMIDEYSAERPDSVDGWDNVISKGYSIIETNYPDMLADYIADTESLRSDLKDLTDGYEAYLKGNYSSSSLDEFTDAYDDAVICVEQVASRSEISDAFYRLSTAYSNLEPADENEAIHKLTITPGRVIAVLLCGGGILASQIYLYKKRKH